MNVLNFKTDVFEGPLDLMLSLISKHKLNIQDIEISVLLEQFLNYISEAHEADVELAGEFLETAARLIFIKTASLLPKHEVEQLKKELEGALIEYALCKATAERLRERFVGDNIFVRSAETLHKSEEDDYYSLIHPPTDILEAVLIVNKREKLKSEPISSPAVALQVTHVTVFTKIVYALKRLKRGGICALKSLFENQNRSEQAAMFLALLELSSAGRIMISEDLEYVEFAQ